MTLDELLNSPQFKQALFDIQCRECERYLEDMQQAALKLNHTPPGTGGCDRIGGMNAYSHATASAKIPWAA